MKKIGLILMCALFVYADLNPKTEILYDKDGYEYKLLQTDNKDLNNFLKDKLLNICDVNLTPNEYIKCYENIENIDV
ncbi:MAG: hypothetical protein IJ923_06620, partial [Campylobacter sp.]|nr:hypothetical protein [Campylobacter sp.]